MLEAISVTQLLLTTIAHPLDPNALVTLDALAAFGEWEPVETFSQPAYNPPHVHSRLHLLP